MLPGWNPVSARPYTRAETKINTAPNGLGATTNVFNFIVTVNLFQVRLQVSDDNQQNYYFWFNIIANIFFIIIIYINIYFPLRYKYKDISQ